MNKVINRAEKMDMIKDKIQELFITVNELEVEFPERRFTIDGHLLGSIGEVLSAYYYGIELYRSSTKVHDGEIGKRKVQIKITQQDNILISAEPDYLLVLYLAKNGIVYEVYNGPGKEPWNTASKKDSHNYRHMRVNKLMKLDEAVPEEERITAINSIPKMKKEYKNIKHTLKV
ncbi:MAG: hypothetical protein IKG15_09510 [Solobacterium sp.]|nr:hypothetical protein [Solobacterium sp.]